MSESILISFLDKASEVYDDSSFFTKSEVNISYFRK